MTTGGKSSYYLTDATGKRTHTYAYGSTGLPRGSTTEAVPQPYRYAGAYLDPTGLYKMGHRYYDRSSSTVFRAARTAAAAVHR
ncbi:hypothetical protein ACF1FC_34560 [Streptomyces sp. NPDC014344]|uniref:hypothetical protein n=1 Tax=Streptomyces sp. NPDC014344 TaxID=3364871 RepID=UPI0036F980E8